MLYVACLKFVCLKGAKLLTDAEQNHFKDISDSKDILNAFDNHVACCLGLTDGMILYLY